MSQRTAWAVLPRGLRDELERMLGSRVTAAISQPGGFSPGFAVRLRLSDGRQFFAKGIDRHVNEVSHGLYRSEAVVMRQLDHSIALHRLPVARLHLAMEWSSWVALVLEDINGKLPDIPWNTPELEQACSALKRAHRHLGPAGGALGPLVERNQLIFTGWRSLAASPAPDDMSTWAREHLGAFVELEAHWNVAMDGTTVLHTDLRSDNIIIGPTGAYIVDWAHACVGPSWADHVLMAPSVAAAGGPDPERFLQMTGPLDADPDSVTALVCAVAGYFVQNSRKPAPPGMPLARASQRHQGRWALSWLRERLRA